MTMTMTMTLFRTVTQRVVTSLTIVPIGFYGWAQVAGITSMTTILAGVTAYSTGFIADPIKEYNPPTSLWKPASALIVPSLLEELLWRAAWIPTIVPVVVPVPPPSSSGILQYSILNLLTTTHHHNKAVLLRPLLPYASAALVLHVLSHPLMVYTGLWPRGKNTFDDPRFLCLATIVLGGATLSYIVSGGSVWAAAITHGIPVALWRDYFGGEQRLSGAASKSSSSSGGDDDDKDKDYCDDRTTTLTTTTTTTTTKGKEEETCKGNNDNEKKKS